MPPTPLTSSIKVMHIVSGDLWAGAEAQVYTLLSNLQNQGNITLHAVILNRGELANRLHELGIHTTILDETTLSSFDIFLRLRKILYDVQPDIIHSHRKKENILSMLACLTTRARSRTVSTIHGAQEHPLSLWKIHRQLSNHINWLCVRYFINKIIAVSEELALKLSAQIPKAKIEMIINGIDSRAVIAQSKLFPVHLPKEFVHVGIVGRLEPVKRIDIFLEAANILVSNYPETPWHFHIIGDGSLTKNMINLSESLHLEDKVTFHGHQNHIHSHIKALNVLVMCSDHEGLPMTALEAMVLSTPIAAHAVGGLVPLLEGDSGGTLVTKHTPEAYAEAVNQLVQAIPPEMAVKGQAKISDYYSSEDNSSNVYKLYSRLKRSKGNV